MRGVLLFGLLAVSGWGEVCGRDDWFGAYGFRLSGDTTIAGLPKPMAAMGRMVFGNDRKISGVSSVNFGGLLLGQPITGTYTFDTNCVLSFELQDDSGAWHHFTGTARTGGASADFHQTDPGTGGRGVLHRVPEVCNNATFRGKYSVTIGSQKTVTIADGNGGLSWTTDDAKNSGTYDVDAECVVTVNFGVQLRGVLVDGGRTVLAVQTDPGKVGTATFTAQ